MHTALKSISLFLVTITERYLTFKINKRIRIKKKQVKQGIILDWLFSFLWAAGVVLVLNQYVLQAYMIPSGSMIPSLLVGDRIFVNKFIYGPELLPSLGSISSKRKPQRYEVAIFESPDYLNRGTGFEILQRVIFMLTLSKVNLNVDNYGNPKVQFLIKRLIGLPGDQVKIMTDGLYFKLKGTNRWMSNSEFRTFTNAQYPDNDPSVDIGQMRKLTRQYAEQRYLNGNASLAPYGNVYDLQGLVAVYEHELNPVPLGSAGLYSQYKNGWYIADKRYFFMGDNRDNSKDSRSYSAVPEKRVLGKAMMVFYPFSRFRMIK